jgi:hypothetical protein
MNISTLRATHSSNQPINNDGLDKQNRIIGLCKHIHEGNISDLDIWKTINSSTIKDLGYKKGTNWFGTVHQPINRSLIYAWVSVYACKNNGKSPNNIENLQDFIKSNFKLHIPADYNIITGRGSSYFNEIVNYKNSEITSYGGQKYNLEVIRSAWKNQQWEDKSLLVSQPQEDLEHAEIYQIGTLRINLNDIEKDRINSLDRDLLFEYIFVNPEGILTDNHNPITQKIKADFIHLIKSKGTRSDYKSYHFVYGLFKKIFVRSTTNIADSKNPTIREMKEAILNSMVNLMRNDVFLLKSPIILYDMFAPLFIKPKDMLTNSSMPLTQLVREVALNSILNLIKLNKTSSRSDAAKHRRYNYQIFKQVFASPTIIGADDNDSAIQAIREAVTDLVRNGKLEMEHNYAVFEHVFVNPEGILADNDNDSTRTIREVVVNLIKKRGTLLESKKYAIFEHIFINPRGILADGNDPVTQAIREAITELLSKLEFNRCLNYKIFEHVFINPVGILTDNQSSATKAVIDAIIKVIKGGGLYPVDMHKVFNCYLWENCANSILVKALENVMLDLLANNKLHEPQVIDKLVNRFVSGEIKADETGQGIDCFLKLSGTANMPILFILIPNIAYFISKDGEEKISQIMQNNLLLVPPAQDLIDQLAEEGLLEALKEIKSDIDTMLVDTFLLAELRTGNAVSDISNIAKREIKNLGRQLNHIALRSLNEDSLTSLLQVVKTAFIMADRQTISEQFKKQVKLSQIKHGIRTHVFNNQELEEEQENQIAEFAELLAKEIDLKIISSQYIVTQYLDLLGISKDQSELAHTLIQEHLNWGEVISRMKSNIFIELQAHIAKGEQLKFLSPRLYYDYVLNTLPYRGAKDIYALLATNEGIPLAVKQKLELVQKYCQLNDYEKEDTGPLSIFVVENKLTRENMLISLQNLDYLNSVNIAGFNLEQFKLLELIEDQSNFNAQNLTLKDFDRVIFPEYLQKLISNKFTAANVVAKRLFNYIITIINDNNFQLTVDQQHKLEQIVYQVSLAPGKGITVPLRFKKMLINTFNDFALLAREHEEINRDTQEKHIIPAGGFIQLKEYLEAQLADKTDNQQLEILSDLLVEKAKQLEFTKNSNMVVQELYDELTQLPSFKDKIDKHEVCYILGVICMDLSSTHALGYYGNGENTAFTRFRLIGAYWLAQAVTDAGELWSQDEKIKINQEIKLAVLDIECSGMITNRLYGPYHKSELNAIFTRVTNILSTRVI